MAPVDFRPAPLVQRGGDRRPRRDNRGDRNKQEKVIIIVSHNLWLIIHDSSFFYLEDVWLRFGIGFSFTLEKPIPRFPDSLPDSPQISRPNILGLHTPPQRVPFLSPITNSRLQFYLLEAFGAFFFRIITVIIEWELDRYRSSAVRWFLSFRICSNTDSNRF